MARKVILVDSESHLSFEQRVPSWSQCFRKISLAGVTSDPVFHLVPVLRRLPVALIVAYMAPRRPAPSPASSHITLPCSPIPTTLTFFPALLIILSLSIGHRLFPISKMFFPPLFLWLIPLSSLRTWGSVSSSRNVSWTSLTRSSIFIICYHNTMYLSFLALALFSVLYLIVWLLD